MHSMETGQKADSCPEQMGQDSMGVCHVTQSSSQFKTYGLFISGMSHLILLDHGWLLVTEPLESKYINNSIKNMAYILIVKLLLKYLSTDA